MAAPTPSGYEFGPFRLEVAERRLLRDGRAVPLQEKLFETLLMLARNPGRLLEKEVILQAIWPNAHVEETNLPHNISLLRRLLGETGATRYIETVPKHGYRFVADVRTIGTASSTSAIPPTRYAKAGDVAVAYQVFGEGPIDLVYVPGWITHLEYGWEQPRVAHFLRRLASFSRVILFDKRGTGLSDRTPGYPTLEDRMDDVGAVMDAVKMERAVIFGASEGGSMSMLFAATHPERTAALALYGTFAKRTWSPDYPWAPRPEERQRWYELLERGWGGTTDLDDLAPSVVQDEAFCNWWSTYLRLGASPGAALTLARLNTQIDTRDVLPAIRVPTLIVHRTGDRDVKVDEARYLASRIRGATFVEQPGEDHLIYAGNVDAVVDAVRRFVAGVQNAHTVERVLTTLLVLEADRGGAADASLSVKKQLCAARDGRLLEDSSRRWVAAFDGPGRAIQAALAAMAAGRRHGLPLRAGIHTGECEITDGTMTGPPIKIASTLAGSALPGTVLVTRTVTDLVVGSRFRFNPHGEARLHGSERWSIYEAVEPES